VKHNNKKTISPAFIAVISSILLLAACDSRPPLSHWDGKWERRISVPKGVQGRCIDERLTVEKKSWTLIAVVHSSYDCNQPFLELGYQGVLREVAIKKDTGDNELFLNVTKIQLVSLADLGVNGRRPLSPKSVEALSAKYVPESNQAFQQHLQFSSDRLSMASNIFQPLLGVAIPTYPDSATPAAYSKRKP